MPNSLNNWLLCIFASLLVIFGPIRYAGHWLISTPHENIAHNLSSEDDPDQSQNQEKETLPLNVLLAQANVSEGKKRARVCQSCHDLASDNANKVGPGLWGIVGRMIAHHPDYPYSRAMKKYAQEKSTWTYQNLNAFFANPRKTVPKTKMSYAGLRNDKQRADLIVYLRTLSSKPLPLPPLEKKDPSKIPPKP